MGANGGRGARVVIADGQPVYREGLTLAVACEDFEVVGVCEDGRAALETITTTKPDIAIIATDLPDIDGVQLALAAEQRGLATRVVLISADPDPAMLYDALAAGAAAFLSKKSSVEEIRSAIRVVAQGGTVLGPDLHEGIAHEIRIRRRRKPVLSHREREILRLAARGHTAREIAAELFISTTTVRTHLENGYEKLGVHDKSSAIVEAMRRGVLT